MKNQRTKKPKKEITMDYFAQAFKNHQEVIANNAHDTLLLEKLLSIQSLSIQCLQLQTIAGLLNDIDPHPIDPNATSPNETPSEQWINFLSITGTTEEKEQAKTPSSGDYTMVKLRDLSYATIKSLIGSNPLAIAIWQHKFSEIATHPLLDNNEKKHATESLIGREHVPVVDSLEENHIELLIYYARLINALATIPSQRKSIKNLGYSALIGYYITDQLKRATRFELIRTASNLLNNLTTNGLGLTYETQLQAETILIDDKNHLATYASFEKEFLKNLSSQINAAAAELSQEIRQSHDIGLEAALAPYLDTQGKLKASTALESSLSTATAAKTTIQKIQQQASTLLSSLEKNDSTLIQNNAFKQQYRNFMQQVFQLRTLDCNSTNYEAFDQYLLTLLTIQAVFDDYFQNLNPQKLSQTIQATEAKIQNNEQAIRDNEQKFLSYFRSSQSSAHLKEENRSLKNLLQSKEVEQANLNLYTTGRAATSEALKVIYNKIELAKKTPVATEAAAEKGTSPEPTESSTGWLSSLSLAATGAAGIVLASAATLLPYALSSLSSAMAEDPASNTTFSL